MHQKWPDQIFPTVNFGFFPRWSFWWAVLRDPPPPTVYGHSNLPALPSLKEDGDADERSDRQMEGPFRWVHRMKDVGMPQGPMPEYVFTTPKGPSGPSKPMPRHRVQSA